MGKIRDFFFRRSNRDSNDSLTIKEIDSRSLEKNKTPQSSNEKLKQFFVKFIGKVDAFSKDRERIVAPDYDFQDIYNASETDSYVKMSLSKYKSLVFKAGYQLKGDNDKAVSYIKKRLKIFGITSQKPFDILLQEISDDIITYSNAFLVKARNEDGIYPGSKANNIFGNAPVSGYFRLDPCCVYIKINKHGKVVSYVYKVNGDTQEIKPYDVIHFYIDRAPDKKYGTPMIVAALEDVKLLRRIEGHIMALIYRFTMPIYHWSVGLEKEGMGAQQKEIDELTNSISNMEMDGSIVTNERTKVSAIGADGTALDATGYLTYFERRVFSALGVSESQMGRGGAKQDADSMEQQIHDTIKHYQRVISIFIENSMFMELLLEGGFDPISNESDYVSFEFNEISLDTKIKLENHEMTKFQSNLITFGEARHQIGKKSDVDKNELYVNMVTNKSAIEQIKAKANAEIKVAKINSELSSGASDGQNAESDNKNNEASKTIKGNGVQKTSKNASNGTTTSINTPSNQHGTTSVKIKESDNFGFTIYESEMSKKRRDVRKKYADIFDFYKKIQDDAVINNTDLKFCLSVSFNEFVKNANDILFKEYSEGFNRSAIEYSPLYSTLSDNMRNSILSIKNDILSAIEKDDGLDINSVFEKFEYRIDYLLSYYPEKARILGIAHNAKMLGLTELKLKLHGDKDSSEHSDIVNLNSYVLDDIPPFHPFCECRPIGLISLQ